MPTGYNISVRHTSAGGLRFGSNVDRPPAEMIVTKLSEEELGQELKRVYGELFIPDESMLPQMPPASQKEVKVMPRAGAPALTKEAFLALRAERKTIKECAVYFKVARQTLEKRIMDWGIKVDRLPYSRSKSASKSASMPVSPPVVDVKEEMGVLEVKPEAYSFVDLPGPAHTTLTLEGNEQALMAGLTKLTLNMLQKEIYKIAKDHGWHEGLLYFPVAIAMLHSELSEALEADRKQLGKDKVAEELADVFIRLLDTCETLGINLIEAVYAKNNVNRTRAYRHGGHLY